MSVAPHASGLRHGKGSWVLWLATLRKDRRESATQAGNANAPAAAIDPSDHLHPPKC